MNKYNPHIHHRRSIRLKGYDYSQAGLYFVTICCQNRAFLFCEPVGAPLVGAQNVGAQNVGAQNVNVQNNIIQTNFENDNDPAMERFDNVEPTGRPQGHAPTAVMVLNDAGKMIETEWLALKQRFSNIELHDFVIMPNHFHGILQIINSTSSGKTVGDIIDAFKSITTVEYIRGVKLSQWQPFNVKLWQRNYYENIIRDEQSYLRISDYIINNPDKWNEDKFYTKI